MKQYRTRKEQIEEDFIRAIKRKAKKAGQELTPATVRAIKEELKFAAMIGACEERDRLLDSLRFHGNNMVQPQPVRDFAHYLIDEVIGESVLEVLGYE